MSAGQLSPDQARYLELVAAGTGLHPVVVRSWIGAESGWGVTKPTHNYLNVGPHETFESVDQAAARVVGLIRNSRHYDGIRGAIPRGPVPQVQAIVASPWDAGHYQRDYGNLLERTYERTAQAAAGGAIPAAFGGLGWADEADQLNDALGLPAVDLAGLLGLDDVGRQVLVAGLGLIFSLAAFAIIALGLQRLTGASPRAALEQVTGAGTGAGRVLATVT